MKILRNEPVGVKPIVVSQREAAILCRTSPSHFKAYAAKYPDLMRGRRLDGRRVKWLYTAIEKHLDEELPSHVSTPRGYAAHVARERGYRKRTAVSA